MIVLNPKEFRKGNSYVTSIAKAGPQGFFQATFKTTEAMSHMLKCWEKLLLTVKIDIQ